MSTTSNKSTTGVLPDDGVPSSSSSSRARAFKHVDGNRRSTFPIFIGNDAADLKQVPADIQAMYGRMGFYRKAKKHAKRAVLVVDPSHLPPDSGARKDFLKQVQDKKKALAYFYGDQRTDCFALLDPGAIDFDMEGLKQLRIKQERVSDMSLTDGEKVKIRAREKAKLRVQQEVKEDLEKEAYNRVRGVRYGFTGEVTDEDSDDDGNGNEDQDKHRPDEVDQVPVDSGSLEDQGAVDNSSARDYQSVRGGIVEQPMFEHQHKLLSPPSALAEPRVLYTDATNNGNVDQGGQGATNKEGATTEEAAEHAGEVTAETAEKEILDDDDGDGDGDGDDDKDEVVVEAEEEDEKQGPDDDSNDGYESNDSKEKETSDNASGEKKDVSNSDAGQHSTKVAADAIKKKRRVSAELAQAEISNQAGFDAQKQIIKNVKAAAMEEKKVMVKEQDKKMKALEKRHKDEMVAVAKEYGGKMAEQKESLEKQHSDEVKEQEGRHKDELAELAKDYGGKMAEQKEALAKEHSDKVTALEKQHGDKMAGRDETEQILKNKVESLNSAVAEHERKERNLMDENNSLREITDAMKALAKRI